MRTVRSRDRQIYSRKRHSIEDARAPDSLTEHEYLFEEVQIDDGGAPVPGRYCIGLCEVEEPVAKTLRRRRVVKQLKR